MVFFYYYYLYYCYCRETLEKILVSTVAIKTKYKIERKKESRKKIDIKHYDLNYNVFLLFKWEKINKRIY